MTPIDLVVLCGTLAISVVVSILAWRSQSGRGRGDRLGRSTISKITPPTLLLLCLTAAVVCWVWIQPLSLVEDWLGKASESSAAPPQGPDGSPRNPAVRDTTASAESSPSDAPTRAADASPDFKAILSRLEAAELSQQEYAKRFAVREQEFNQVRAELNYAQQHLAKNQAEVDELTRQLRVADAAARAAKNESRSARLASQNFQLELTRKNALVQQLQTDLSSTQQLAQQRQQALDSLAQQSLGSRQSSNTMQAGVPQERVVVRPAADPPLSVVSPVEYPPVSSGAGRSYTGWTSASNVVPYSSSPAPLSLPPAGWPATPTMNTYPANSIAVPSPSGISSPVNGWPAPYLPTIAY